MYPWGYIEPSSVWVDPRQAMRRVFHSGSIPDRQRDGCPMDTQSPLVIWVTMDIRLHKLTFMECCSNAAVEILGKVPHYELLMEDCQTFADVYQPLRQYLNPLGV